MNLKVFPKDLIFENWRSRGRDDLFDNLAAIQTSSSRFSNSPQEKEQLAKYNQQKLYILIFASNKFEGSKLSQLETFRILSSWLDRTTDEILSELANQPFEEKLKKRDRPPSRREVLQHYLAHRLLKENLSKPLTEELIKEIHRILMTGLLDDDGLEVSEGNYRTENISAKGFLFLDPKFVSESMKALVGQFNVQFQDPEVDSCLLASWLMAELLTIHPFNDGNGRISRLLFNYALAKRGMDHIIPLVENEEQRKMYMDSLKRYQRFTPPSNPCSRLSTLWLLSSQALAYSWSNFYLSFSSIR